MFCTSGCSRRCATSVRNAAASSSVRVCGSGLSSAAIGSLPCGRSEEHTSELQSLMRISYAVFCLNKTKIQTPESENEEAKHLPAEQRRPQQTHLTDSDK